MARPKKPAGEKYQTMARQLGRVDDATWAILQAAAKREGETFIGWALPILIIAAKRNRGPLKITAATRERIFALHKAGKTQVAIGKLVGVSQTQVGRILGLPSGRKPVAQITDEQREEMRSMAAAGIKNMEIAGKYGVHHTFVARVLSGANKRKPTKATPAVAAQIRKLRDEGKTLVDIGEIVGLSQSHVSKVLRKQDTSGG